MSAGDVLFIFESVGYTWTAYDARDAREVGETYRSIAKIYPTDAEGNRLNEITVNRATRHYVALKARWAGQRIEITEWSPYDGGLTDATHTTVTAAAATAFAAHPVPELTGAELAERAAVSLVASAQTCAHRAFRESALYNTSTITALTAAERRDVVQRATEAFRVELAGLLGVAGQARAENAAVADAARELNNVLWSNENGGTAGSLGKLRAATRKLLAALGEGVAQ